MLLEIIIAKIIINILSLIGSNASALPGKILLRLDPNILPKLISNNFEEIILVTGTNGKTTTTKLISDYYQKSEETIIFNQGGSNLKQGIVSTLLKNVTIKGRYISSVLLLEIDEATLSTSIDEINPTKVLILNLMRDQLDRFSEVDLLAHKMFTSIDNLSQKPTIIYNGDDPILEKYFSKFDHIKKFGVGSNIDIFYHSDHTSEQILSPIDGQPLRYSKRFFSNLGHYYDIDKKFVRCHIDVELTNYTPRVMTVRMGKDSISLTLDKESRNYNIYNYLAVITLLDSLHIFDPDRLTGVIDNLTAFGREEIIHFKDNTITLYLIKNPNGANQLIYSLSRENISNVIISLSDNLADGRDISWIWDTDFSLLKKANIFTTGTRSDEMSMCLAYQNIKSQSISSLDSLLKESTSQHYVALSTYTGMLKIREALTGSKIGS